MAILATTALFLLKSMSEPVVQFANPALNVAAVCLAHYIPLVLLILALRIHQKWLKWGIVGILLPVSLLYSAIGLVYLSELRATLSQGYSSAFEPLKRVAMAGYDVQVYRRNGGATTSHGILIQQEQTLFPGVLLVKRAASWYPASEADVEPLDQNSIKVTIPPYSASRPETADMRIFRLKRFSLLSGLDHSN